ncbi:MAG: cytochrome [Bdellovibrio sp.]
MFLQGDLQAVFDALFTIGAIDPVLRADWRLIQEQMDQEPEKLSSVLASINSCAGDRELLMQRLHSLEPDTLSFVALEVARELAEYTERQALH